MLRYPARLMQQSTSSNSGGGEGHSGNEVYKRAGRRTAAEIKKLSNETDPCPALPCCAVLWCGVVLAMCEACVLAALAAHARVSSYRL